MRPTLPRKDLLREHPDFDRQVTAMRMSLGARTTPASWGHGDSLAFEVEVEVEFDSHNNHASSWEVDLQKGLLGKDRS